LSAWSLSNSRKNLWQLATYAAGSVAWSSVNHGSKSLRNLKFLIKFLFFICILSLCLVPVHGDELASIPTGVRPCAGLSFKSGYQQTGYVHTIGSYRMCQVLLLLGAWSLVKREGFFALLPQLSSVFLDPRTNS